MSYTLNAQIIGAKELSEAFAKAPEVARQAFSQAIRNSAIDLKNKAQDLAPRVTSRLRGSINYQGPFISADNNVYAKVGTNVEYAPYQEYGTGIYAGRGMITPKRARVLAWKGRDNKWHIAWKVRGVRGKFYFKNAIEYARPILSENLREALAKIISHLAGK